MQNSKRLERSRTKRKNKNIAKNRREFKNGRRRKNSIRDNVKDAIFNTLEIDGVEQDKTGICKGY